MIEPWLAISLLSTPLAITVSRNWEEFKLGFCQLAASYAKWRDPSRHFVYIGLESLRYNNYSPWSCWAFVSTTDQHEELSKEGQLRMNLSRYRLCWINAFGQEWCDRRGYVTGLPAHRHCRSVFEVIEDHDEMYYPLGIYQTAQQAISNVMKNVGIPDGEPPSIDGYEEGTPIVIKERFFGSDPDNCETVWTGTFCRNYDDYLDDYAWTLEKENSCFHLTIKGW